MSKTSKFVYHHVKNKYEYEKPRFLDLIVNHWLPPRIDVCIRGIAIGITISCSYFFSQILKRRRIKT